MYICSRVWRYQCHSPVPALLRESVLDRDMLHALNTADWLQVPSNRVHQQVAEVVAPVSFVSCQTPPTLRCLKTRGLPN